MGLFSKLFGKTKNDDSSNLIADIKNGPDSYSVEVVGESHYQENLETICGGRTEDSQRRLVKAILLLEDDNKLDKNSVVVIVGKFPVGHLDREAAISFRKELNRTAPGVNCAQCNAIIVGGWDRGPDDRGYFGIKLDLPIK